MASQITCITKPDPHSSHEAISFVGGIRGNGSRFYITRQECALDIARKTESYFVRIGTSLLGSISIDVEAYQRHGEWYIKTRADNTLRDNLLSLPQCS